MTFIFKVIVCGDTGVGKTTLVQRFVDGRFIADTKSTIGADFSLKHVALYLPSKINTTLQIWDMAGEEKFRSVIPYYITGTDGIIFAFSADNLETLDSLESWMEVVDKYLITKVPIVIISTKNDLVEIDENNERLKKFMKDKGLINFVPTSAKSGKNYSLAFERIAELIAKPKLDEN